MTKTMPIVLVAGLACSPRIYAPLIPALWRCGPVTVANHIRDASMAEIARRILAEAPPRFALAGHSMGGYIAFEMIKQAPERIDRLALLNTHPLPDAPEAAQRRHDQIARVEAGDYHGVLDELAPKFVHPSRAGDAGLRQLVHDMGDDIGPEAFVRQLQALISRADMRPLLTAIRCPTLVLTSDADAVVPPQLSKDMAESIEGAKLVVINDCGHLPQVEKTAEMSAAMLDWIG